MTMGPRPDLFQRIGKTRLEEGSLHRIQLKFHLWNNLSGMKYFVDTQNNRITLGNSSLKAAWAIAKKLFRPILPFPWLIGIPITGYKML